MGTVEGSLSPHSETWFDCLRKAAAVRTRTGLIASRFQFCPCLTSMFAEKCCDLVFVFCPVQRGVAIEVFCVHCRFFGEPRGDDIEMTLEGAAVQWGPSVFITGIGIRTPSEEQHSDLRVAVVRRAVKRGSSEGILSVDIRATGQVVLDGLDIAVCGII